VFLRFCIGCGFMEGIWEYRRKKRKECNEYI